MWLLLLLLLLLLILLLLLWWLLLLALLRLGLRLGGCGRILLLQSLIFEHQQPAAAAVGRKRDFVQPCQVVWMNVVKAGSKTNQPC